MVFSKHAICSLLAGILVLAYAIDPTAAETSLPDSVCANYAVHAGGAITFAGTSITGGNVGSVGAISGAYTMDDDVESALFDPASVQVAINEAMAIRDGVEPILAAEIGGQVFTPGTYRSAATITIAAGAVVTLNGGPDDIFLFQAVTTMVVGVGSKIVLTGGAQAKNVLWAMGGTFITGTTTTIEGSITVGGAVTIAGGNIVNGNLVAKGAVTIATNVKMGGCVIATGAMTVAAGSTVTIPQAVSNSATVSAITQTVDANTEPVDDAITEPVDATLDPTPASTDGLCANFAVHAGTAITFATNQISGGNVGVSPGTAITGEYAMDAGSSESIGATGLLSFDPATVTTALALERNVTTAAKATDPEIGGKTFTPGTYRASGSGTFNIEANTDVTLNGSGAYLFQATSTMLTGANSNIILTNGARAEDVIWALGNTFTSGADNVFQGSIQAGTAITIGANSKVHGNIFAEIAITLGANAGIEGCVIALSVITFGAGSYVGSISEPVPQLAAHFSSCICEGYAAYAGTAITFGATNKVGGGSVGGASGIPITGSYVANDGTIFPPPLVSETIGDSAFFATTMTNALTAARKIRDDANATAPEIGGVTFTPGTYRASGSGTFNVAANTHVTLNGPGVYLFQATSTMLTGANCNIYLINGAKAEDVVWALGTTFTSGADNIFQGSIRAGSVITVGARNTVHGSVFAGTAITFGADVAIDGCAIALSALTFGAGNNISSAEIPANCQEDAITEAVITDLPKPNSIPKFLASACDADVVLVRQIGYSSYTDIPINIISQGSPPGEVTFEISQKWTAKNNLANLTVRFQDEYLAFPKCHAFDNVDATWTNNFTAICTKRSEIALVEVWASGDSFTTQYDDAMPAKCTVCNNDINTTLAPMVKYVFKVECVSTCPAFTTVKDSPTASPAECVFEDSLNAVCDSVGIHAHDTITFASGEKTRVVGDIGVFPSTSITGEHEIKPGGQILDRGKSEAFANNMWGVNGSYDQKYARRAAGEEIYLGEAAEIGNQLFYPGTYRAGTGINFAYGLTVTLDGGGNEDAEFLFQAGTTLITAADSYFILQNGAQAKNVVWALGTAATLGARSILEGSILAGTSITFGTMSEVRGCAIAQNAVTFESRGYVNVRVQTNCPNGSANSSGSCGNFAVHARDTITFAGTAKPSVIKNGDMGVSPGTSITGLYELDGGDRINDSGGFASDVMFNHADLRSRRSDEVYWGLGIHEIGGETLIPGTYRAGTAINFALGLTVTLDGQNEENPTWLFQAGSTLITAADTHFILKNGAKAENIVWAVGTAVTLGARSVVEGSVLAGTAITMGVNSRINGCAISMTAISFEGEGLVELP